MQFHYEVERLSESLRFIEPHGLTPLQCIVQNFSLYGAKGEVPESAMQCWPLMGYILPERLGAFLRSMKPMDFRSLVSCDWTPFTKPPVWAEWTNALLLEPRGQLFIELFSGEVPLCQLGSSEKVEVFHGLDAFNEGSPISNAGQFYTEESKCWGVCCSNVPIGTVGLILSGDLKAAFFKDVYTWVSPESGHRCVTSKKMRYLVQGVLPPVGPYQEIIITGSVPLAVWFKGTGEGTAAQISQHFGLKKVRVS